MLTSIISLLSLGLIGNSKSKRHYADRMPDPRPGKCRVYLRLESLENRAVPATFYVTNANDSGPGSLRQAILDANAGLNEPHDIYLIFDTVPDDDIVLESQLPMLIKDIHIHGRNEDISRNPDSPNDFRFFEIYEASTSVIDNLDLFGGRVSTGEGGGIWNRGQVTLNNCLIESCVAMNGGGISNRNRLTLNQTVIGDCGALHSGGGVYSTGNPSSHEVYINNSLLHDNRAEDGYGGAIYSANGFAELQVYHTAIEMNYARIDGGGIFHSSGHLVVIGDILAEGLSTNWNADSNALGSAIYTTNNVNSVIDVWIFSNGPDFALFVGGSHPGLYVNLEKVLDPYLIL